MKKTFICIPFFLLWCSGALAQRTWVKITSPIIGKHRAIDFFSADSGYVMGDSALYFSSDGGTTWIQRKLPVTNAMYMHFLNADTGVISASFRRIFHTFDGGRSWQENIIDGINILDGLLDFHFIRGSSFGVISNECNTCDTGIIPYTTNGGISWAIRKSNFTNNPVYLAFRTPKVGLGMFFNRAFLINFLASTGDSGNNWVAIDSGGAVRFGGATVLISLQNGNWLAGFSYSGHQSIIYTSTDDGVSWDSTASLNANLSFLGFFDSFGYSLTESSGIFSTSDYGKHWITDNVPTSAFSFSLSVPSAQVAYCITDSVILKTDSRSKVEKVTFQTKFTILTNPISNSADFQFDALKESSVFELFDLLGRLLLRPQLAAGQASFHLDMQKYPAGFYFARLGGETVRFVKY